MEPRLFLPQKLLSIAALSWAIRETSRSGGPSVLGSEQIINGPAGRWSATLSPLVTTMSGYGSEEYLAYRGLMARLRGRSRVIDLPHLDARGPGVLHGFPQTSFHSDGTGFSDGMGYGQGGVPVTLVSNADLNDTDIVLSYPAGIQPHVGQCITLPNGWMHMISDLIAREATSWTVTVSPWLREDYAAGSPVEVDRPTSRMRLMTDDSGSLPIRAGEPWTVPTLDFIEAF